MNKMCLNYFNLILESIYKKIKKDNEIDIKFYPEFEKLNFNVNQLYKFLHYYDYDCNHKANGFRSLFKVCLKFLELFEKKFNSSEYFIINNDLLNIINIINFVVLQALSLNEKLKEKDETDDNLFLSNQFEIPNLIKLYKKELSTNLHSMYENSGFFWFCKSCRLFFKNFLIIMSIYISSSSKDSFKCVCDPEFRAKCLVKFTLDSNISVLKNFWSLTEYSLFRDKIPNLILKKPTILKDIIINNRQNLFYITLEEKKVLKFNQLIETSNLPEKLPIKCRLLYQKIENKIEKKIENNNSLIFHAHGGGFISQSPKSHEIYLRQWSINLLNVPILSIDYSLSPEAKYPVALQQLLDAYIWINSAQFIKIIGYKPKKIILIGDSAGGNLVSALLLVLNDIKNKYSSDLIYSEDLKINFNFIMPSSLICIYTPFRLQLLLSSAKLMSIWDPILPLGILLSCLEAYIHDNSKDIQCKSNLSVQNFGLNKKNLEKMCFLDENFYDFVDNKEDFSKKIDQNILKNENFVKSYLSFDNFIKSFYDILSVKDKILKKYEILLKDVFGTKNSSGYFQPWYNEKNEEQLKNYIKKINTKTSYPYVSPLLYDNFEQLKEVNLYLIALDFDVFLDDSVLMARRWKGKVSFDILEDLPHGFLNFNLISEEAKNATCLVFNRIKEAINMKN